MMTLPMYDRKLPPTYTYLHLHTYQQRCWDDGQILCHFQTWPRISVCVWYRGKIHIIDPSVKDHDVYEGGRKLWERYVVYVCIDHDDELFRVIIKWMMRCLDAEKACIYTDSDDDGLPASKKQSVLHSIPLDGWKRKQKWIELLSSSTHCWCTSCLIRLWLESPWMLWLLWW